MALTVPDVDQLALHLGVEDIEVELGFTEERAEYLLPMATDLLYFATRCAKDPETGTPEARMKLYGILEMVHFLLVTDGDKEEQFSPFQSERMGSYSYSKMAVKVRASGNSGGDVPMFDIAVSALRALCSGGGIEMSSTQVFSHETPDFDRPTHMDYFLGAPD